MSEKFRRNINDQILEDINYSILNINKNSPIELNQLLEHCKLRIEIFVLNIKENHNLIDLMNEIIIERTEILDKYRELEELISEKI